MRTRPYQAVFEYRTGRRGERRMFGVPGTSAGLRVRRAGGVSWRRVLVVWSRTAQRGGAEVMTENPTQHYVVIQSGSKGEARRGLQKR